MRWDDLQLLKLIYELEEAEIGVLGSGFLLMQRMAAGEPLDPNRDYQPFARELILARRAGYIDFKDQPGFNMVFPNPETDPNSWLQQVRDIRLTLPGRDRALGREVIRPLPDPSEDNDSPITGLTLEEIAREIGNTYTGSQLPRFLRESGIPEEFVPAEVTGSKWEYVMAVLERLHDGGSSARRELRVFIGSWLERRLHTWPQDDLRKRIVAQLAQQGWRVRDGRLVIGERSFESAAALTTSARDARIAALHSDVRQAAERYLKNHMEVAIFEAMKAVNKRVREMTGLDLDGSELMNKAFSEQHPLVVLADLSTETGRNVQAGYRLLFTGAVRGIRNPDAHELFQPLDDEDALEKLGFASMLMRQLDAAQTQGIDAPDQR